MTLAYSDVKLPFYRNTRPFFAGLDVTDAGIAAVLGGLNLLEIGNTGTGKTQKVQDIYNHLFGGNKTEGGHGVFIRAHPEIDIYNEIFTELNIKKADRQLTKNIEALVFCVDELNRAPVVAQNQFFGLGDGILDYKGTRIHLGRNGYHVLIATANIGNGEFQGTFETDKALFNRFHVVIDLDYEGFKPTSEDEMEIDRLEADPNVKIATTRDISDKILESSKEIGLIAKDPGVESLAVVNYLRSGLENCLRMGRKGRTWPLNCQDCDHNKEGTALCSYVRAPVRRTNNAIIKYAGALQYLAKLKNPTIEIDPVDLMFKSFELTGAYQFLLNPQVLQQQHFGANPRFMAEVVAKLKEDYRKNEDYIIGSIEEAKRGRKVTTFYDDGTKVCNYDDISEEVRTKKNIPKTEPYNDQRQIGMSWMKDFIDFNMKGKHG